MKLLLDTHVVLWRLSGVQRLGVRATETIGSAAELAFSVVSFAEIGVKAAVVKLTVPDDLHAHVVGTGLRVLGRSPDHGRGDRPARLNELLPAVVGVPASGSKDDSGPCRNSRSRYRQNGSDSPAPGSRTRSPTQQK